MFPTFILWLRSRQFILPAYLSIWLVILRLPGAQRVCLASDEHGPTKSHDALGLRSAYDDLTRYLVAMLR